MLLVFLSLLVFLLSLVAVAVQFGRDAGIFKKLPVVVVIAMSTLVIPSRAAAQITEPDQSSPAAPPRERTGDGSAARPIAATRL